jgi:hypothetical protein
LTHRKKKFPVKSNRLSGPMIHDWLTIPLNRVIAIARVFLFWKNEDLSLFAT